MRTDERGHPSQCKVVRHESWVVVTGSVSPGYVYIGTSIYLFVPSSYPNHWVWVWDFESSSSYYSYYHVHCTRKYILLLQLPVPCTRKYITISYHGYAYFDVGAASIYCVSKCLTPHGPAGQKVRPAGVLFENLSCLCGHFHARSIIPRRPTVIIHA